MPFCLVILSRLLVLVTLPLPALGDSFCQSHSVIPFFPTLVSGVMALGTRLFLSGLLSGNQLVLVKKGDRCRSVVRYV